MPKPRKPVGRPHGAVEPGSPQGLSTGTSLLHTLQGLADGMDTDTEVLIAAATRIRVSISALRQSSRNPVYQQSREEWLRAYDEADMLRQPKTWGAL
jgi:hypothetical protein